MDALVSDGSLGGGSIAGAASEKMMEKEVKNNTSCPSLSMKTRFIVFGICYTMGKYPTSLFNSASLGIIFAILAFISISDLTKFAVIYTLATVCQICGSFFLWGPMG